MADIHRVVQSNGEKYLCFTRLASSWFVSVTDGVTLWRVDLDEEEVDALRDLAGVNTVEAYLTRFRYFSYMVRKFRRYTVKNTVYTSNSKRFTVISCLVGKKSKLCPEVPFTAQ